MRLRSIRAIALLLGGAALVMPVPPVGATTLKNGAFTGVMVIGGGTFGDVCTPPKPCPALVALTAKTGPKGEPQINPTPLNGNNAVFTFASTTCAKLSASALKAQNKNGLDPCTIAAAGNITGWCDLATGTGVMFVRNLSGTKADLVVHFKFTVLGRGLILSAGNQDRNFYASSTFDPAPALPGQPSCTNKTANTFTLVGGFNFKDLTV